MKIAELFGKGKTVFSCEVFPPKKDSPVDTIYQTLDERMVSLCGASIPRKLSRILARYGDHPEALREAGIAYAIDQISDLVAAGVDGIHLYTMNNPAVARQISDSVSAIRRV